MMLTVNRYAYWSPVHLLCMYIVRDARGSSLINCVARSNKLESGTFKAIYGHSGAPEELLAGKTAFSSYELKTAR